MNTTIFFASTVWRCNAIAVVGNGPTWAPGDPARGATISSMRAVPLHHTGRTHDGSQPWVACVRQVAHAVKPGGHIIVAPFGPEGPTHCSGLDVVRYGPESLYDEFGTSFRLVKPLTELHRTPAGSIQQLTYCYCNILS
jgi:hypothetical protein